MLAYFVGLAWDPFKEQNYLEGWQSYLYNYLLVKQTKTDAPLVGKIGSTH